MLEAAAAIKDMARSRPSEAPAMLKQAQHLVELAEQIRTDWLSRKNEERVRAIASLAPERRDRAAETA
ncbi:MAG: hypothetical protein JO010_02425 [Alphaproteobacteria bacterium]|nr:hypothetical protein [Alphaproteobacteria bacterium]